MTRILRSYDHRFRDLVRSSGDIGHATRRGVPRSTARGWLTSARVEVVTHDTADLDVLNLQQEVLALRARVDRMVALLRVPIRNPARRRSSEELTWIQNGSAPEGR